MATNLFQPPPPHLLPANVEIYTEHLRIFEDELISTEKKPLSTPIVYLPILLKAPNWVQIFSELSNRDSDGDGLTDVEEILYSATSPWHVDTDVFIAPYVSNNISDAEEDSDLDGISNIDEIQIANGYSTDPLLFDTDGDGIGDQNEIELGTNPLQPDTDGDALTDDSEIRLGTNPLVKDSDGDGILDGQEVYTTVTTLGNGTISVALTGVADIAKGVTIRVHDEDIRFENITGQIGPAVEVISDTPFEVSGVQVDNGIEQASATSIGRIELMHHNDALGFQRTSEIANVAAASASTVVTSTASTFVLLDYASWRSSQDAQLAITAQVVDDGTDTDGDGLTDAQEIAGFVVLTGGRIYTDPNEWDMDGDGLSDAEEVGASTPNGYTFPSDPRISDSDDDGLLDPEELGIGTDPYQTDTDGDTLSDSVEVNIDFNPLDPNPDGDYRRDDVEFDKGSDPTYFNATPLVAARRTIQGAILGDFGENLVIDGWLAEDTFISLSYMSGWVASGFVGIGDIRDTAASLIRLDAVDTLLNALAFVPLAGDALKIGKIVDKVATFARARAKNLQPIIRWTVKNFENMPFLDQLLGYLGYSDEVIDKYCRLGIIAATLDTNQTLCPSPFFTQLAKRNGPQVVNDVIAKGGGFFKKVVTSQQWASIQARAANPNLWDAAATNTERLAVESAVEVLSSTGAYDILYVQRRSPLYYETDSAGNLVGRYLMNGPDLVAVNRQTGETVIVEIKGKAGDKIFNNSRFRGKLSGNRYFQPERTWLVTNPQRYLNPLAAAIANNSDPLLQTTLTRLQSVVQPNGTYEAILFGFADTKATFGKFDRIWDKLNTDALRVDTYLVNP